MPRLNKPPSDDLLQEAVELRIGGYKWEIVAEKVKRAFNTVRQWPVRYPERWEAAVERAERRLTVDSNAESVVVLRNMLRADDLKMRWHAAKTLVGLRIEIGKRGLRLMAARAAAGNPTDPATDHDYQYYRFLQQHSDRELKQLVEAMGFRPADRIEHGHDDHAGEAATRTQDSTCNADSSAHGQHGRVPTSENT